MRSSREMPFSTRHRNEDRRGGQIGKEVKVESVWLDYAKAGADPELTTNLSGVA